MDIYNEGVDVPNVNALFFFRPTESATVFLQQLGRGLRRARGKSELVVFDLTGRQRMEFRFDRRLRAVLGHSPRELREFVQSASGRLPTGCMISFDEQAREQVLQQIERAIPTDLHGLRMLLQEPAHRSLSLEAFLHETDVDLEDIYRKDRSWYCVALAQEAQRIAGTLAFIVPLGETLEQTRLTSRLHILATALTTGRALPPLVAPEAIAVSTADPHSGA